MLKMHLIITSPPQQLEPLLVLPCVSPPPGFQERGNEALPKRTSFNKLNLHFDPSLADRPTRASNTPGSQFESAFTSFPSSWFQHRDKQRDMSTGEDMSVEMDV